MTRRRRARGNPRAGFTLIEMLAVLAIVALIAGLSTQLARPPVPRLRVEAAARALCATARATRMRAIATRDITIEISGNRAAIDVNWLTGATRCSLP
ncbi:MAG: prepilin-type N-terminal cleavage/methylation domain-containing protein [Roseiarcus sp.]